MGRQYSAQLQDYDPGRFRISPLRSGSSWHSRLDSSRLGTRGPTFRARKRSRAIPLAERRDQLRHHGGHLSHARDVRQVAQYKMGCSRWTGRGTVRYGVVIGTIT